MIDSSTYSWLTDWSARCNGRFGCTKPIATAFALRKAMGENSCLLAGGIEPYKMIAPELQQATVTTMGEGALLTDYGQLDNIQSLEDPFRCQPDRITVRVAHKGDAVEDQCRTALSNLDEQSQRPPAFYVFDDVGNIVHRIDITNSDDALIMASACSAFDRWEGSARLFKAEHCGVRGDDRLISLIPHLNRSKYWNSLGQHGHLDDVLRDGGKSRFNSLQRSVAGNAFETNPAVLPHFLKYIVQREISFTRIVARPGIMQAHRGRVDAIEIKDQILFTQSGHSMMALDMRSVDSVWVVGYQSENKHRLSIEIYDNRRNCLAIVSDDPAGPHHDDVDWTELAQSLPARDSH